MTITRESITGLVLAGGRGSRMGGVDKGLQPHRGQPLAAHALARLAPQVGPLAVNANRHAEAYAAFGQPVWPDALADFPGPLAGFLAGLERCVTPWLVTVPCDTPGFPPDLVARLAEALVAEDASLAIAATRETARSGGPVVQPHPVFCLLCRDLAADLSDFLHSGQRSILRWTARHRCATAIFDDAPAFTNANTLEDLRRLQP